jgi:hypothetical protein
MLDAKLLLLPWLIPQKSLSHYQEQWQDIKMYKGLHINNLLFVRHPHKPPLPNT